MHGVLRLIQNELSKILHQMSWKILTLLLLLLSIGLPLLNYAMSDHNSYSGFYAGPRKMPRGLQNACIQARF